jgi:acyl-CoA thioesterase-1
MVFLIRLILICIMLASPVGAYAQVMDQAPPAPPAPDFLPKRISIVVAGDYLVAGKGISQNRDFASILELDLLKNGYQNVKVTSSSVDNETTTSVMYKMEGIVKEKPYMVILELGLNDVTQKVPLQTIYSNLSKIITYLHANRIRVLLVGFDAPLGAGSEYTEKFSGMYKYLSTKFRVPLQEDFTKDLLAEPTLLAEDKIHPNQNGVEKLAASITPTIDKMLGKGN